MDGAVRALRIDDGLEVLLFPVGGDEEGSFLAVAERPGKAAFEDATLFRGLVQGEGITGVQTRVAEEEVERAVKCGRAGLGDDLDAAAAGTRIFGRVGIVVNLHFLDSGGGYAGAARFDAIDDESDAAGGDGPGVEEAGHGANVVLIEDGEVV